MAQQGSASGLSLAGRVVFGSLSAGTFGLGIWQTQRYFEKRDLVAERQRALQMPPLQRFSFDEEPFRRMQLKGTFRYDKECLVGPRGPPLGALPNKPGSSSGGMARGPMGYFVLTPLILAGGDGNGMTMNNNKSKGATSGKDDGENQFVVWVNRGWVPQSMVDSDDYNNERYSRNSSTSSTSSVQSPGTKRQRRQQVIAWDRPNETTTSGNDAAAALSAITVVSSNPETPRFLVAGHKLTEVHPPRLFWFDMETLRSLMMTTAATTDGGSSSGQQSNNIEPQQQCHVLSLVTAVRDDSSTNDDENNTDGTTTTSKTATAPRFVFPITPPASSVGDFKTGPLVHAGYAVTWYGLAAAGFYMTRLMILKR